MGLGRYLSALMRKKVWLSKAWSPPQGQEFKGPVGPKILVLFVLPKEDVIGLHDIEKHRQEEVEIGPQSSTLIPLPYRGRRRLKSQATSSRTSSQNVDGRVKLNHKHNYTMLKECGVCPVCPAQWS